ncbi:hypothetical protein AB852_28200 [Streptomyces uncialis]|uniref:Uncharacterized protein n=2 Tax=Streptomyces uncialis TaxID=1048205 RepID=A0A1Q4V131_9ACTN|nr:hypothetical protein AB852_28200 [Streptomyces uncialis]
MSMNTSLKRSLVAPAAGALLAGLFSLGVAAPASAASATTAGPQAHPSGCSYGINHRSGTYARCDHHNGGSYRAVGQCKRDTTGAIKFAYGTWKQSGFSYSSCGAGYTPHVAGVELSPRNNT